MKTIEEFIKEIESSETLKNELKAIKDKYALERFLQNNECSASVNDFAKYVKSTIEGELTDDDAAAVAGGKAAFAIF